jgi:hypothetical protein
MGRRHHTRALAPISVVDADEPGGPAYRARDISAGGLFLLRNKPLSVGATRRLVIEHRGERIEAEAQVVRSDSSGVALQFTHVTTELRTRIRNLLVALVYEGAPLDEKRRARRFETASPVLWILGSVQYRSTLTNLSSAGANIRAERPPEIGCELYVQLPMVELRGGAPVVEEVHGCRASVVRHTEDGFAVEFKGASDDFRSVVRSWESSRRR